MRSSFRADRPRPRRGGRRDGPARLRRARLPGARGAGAHRAGSGPVRPHQRRRQGLGTDAALLGARLSGRRGGRERFELGTAGAGFGATTFDLKGGLGSASAVTARGYRVGALVACNAVGRATRGASPYFWAAPYERAGEFGGLGSGPSEGDGPLAFGLKNDDPANTNLAVVVTDAPLTKAQVKRFAMGAQDGFALALRPAHAPTDGDTVFAAATGVVERAPDLRDLTEIGMLGAECVARAVARAVYEATPSRSKALSRAGAGSTGARRPPSPRSSRLRVRRRQFGGPFGGRMTGARAIRPRSTCSIARRPSRCADCWCRPPCRTGRRRPR